MVRGLLSVLVVLLSTLGVAGSASAASILAWDRNSNGIYEVDTATRAASLVAGSLSTGVVSEIELDVGNNRLYLFDNVYKLLRRVNPATGAEIGSTGLSYSPNGNVFTSMELIGGALYGGLAFELSPTSPTTLAILDPLSGAITEVGGTGINSPLGGLAYDGTTLYAVSAGGSTGALYRVDLVSGVATWIGDTGVGMTGLEFGPDGVLYGLANRNQPLVNHLLAIDTGTGAATDLGLITGLGGNTQLVGITSSYSPSSGNVVPLPAPLALGLFGLVGLAILRRRRLPA